ncbi:hypothetical protein EH243_14390 [Amphritea opalescens]|uniref:Uncharacterized protein n=1 Tax=Amphritea opalescens TaxID=2490544 RepID=A0A430KNH6_9GAMM|nr:hypothetical protein [Amphritea opalescens]RTE65048.1 hypothetical protein EH243_14390 [Amphritea opalescens]
MKTLITTIALASALAAGTASATNFEVGQLGGIDVQATSHSTSAAVMETSNLPGSSYSSALFIGNK